MANSYYAAAVKSASLSWKAFLFGSLDPGSFITVDKPPAAIWIMALSARVFGFSSWSMLVPQALAGVASVLVLHRLVRRWAGEIAGLLAALAFALTPVAVVIFRYNNPDALLTLLLLLAAWGVWSAVESGSTCKLALAGVALGFAFLTKMLMAFMVLPAFTVVYLLFGPPRLSRRVVQLAAALGAMLVSGGWWLLVVGLMPEAGRPYVGGTTGNSWLELVTSRTGGYLSTAAQTAQSSGDPGWLRVFNNLLGGQAAWFVPVALAGLVAGLGLSRRAARTDRVRAGYVLWGLWTLVMMLVFSYVQGTFHSYYTVVLAPGVAALAGAGSVELWRIGRKTKRLCWLLPAVIAGAAVWSGLLLMRVSGYAPGLALAVIVTGGVASLILLAVALWPARLRARRGLLLGAVVVGAAALLAGPLAFDVSTAQRIINGNDVKAGPITRESLGGSVDDLTIDEGLVAYLQERQAGARYLVAVQTTTASVPLILATGEPVVTIGGYKGRDPVPTVAQLERMVATGELRYALLRDTGDAVTAWIVERGTVVPTTEYDGNSIDGTLYCLP